MLDIIGTLLGGVLLVFILWVIATVVIHIGGYIAAALILISDAGLRRWHHFWGYKYHD